MYNRMVFSAKNWWCMKRKFTVRIALCLLSVLLLAGCDKVEDRKAKYFQRGMDLFEQGNYVKARLEFKNVLQIDPKDAEGYYMFGQIEEKEQNWRKAYALYLRAVELNPKHAKAQIHLGRLYALGGAPEKALAAAEAVLKEHPEDPAALVLKGLAEARLGKRDVALEKAKAAFEIDPGNTEAISLMSALYADQGKLDQAIELARKGIEINPERLGSYLLLARLYEKVGDSDGTIGLLEKMIELKPDDLQGRIRLASYYLNKKKEDRAEQVLRDAVKAMPESDDAKLALVEFLRKNGGEGDAERALKAFIAAAPENYKLQLGLATLYVSKKRADAAEQVLRQLIERAADAPDGLEARIMLAKLLVGDKRKDEALALVEEVLAQDPKAKEALLIRAALALEGNDPDKGIADLRTLLREDPGYVKAHRLKARAHLLKGEVELARQSLEDAIQAKPQEAAANFELVQLLVKTGELDDAVTVLEKMRRFTPDNRLVLQTIAKIRAGQKKWDAVMAAANDLTEKHPDEAAGFYYRGLALQGQGKIEESVQAFAQSLEKKPNAVEPLIAIARSYLVLKQPEKALQRIREAIAQNPKHFLALNLEGEVNLTQQRFDQAEASFRKALELKPNWATPYKNLAKLRVFQKKPEEALQFIKEGYEQSGDAGLGIELAAWRERQGDRAGAIALYRELLQRNPRLVVAANNLAMLLVAGQPDQQALDQALALVERFELSDNPIYLDTLGLIYLKRGELDPALKALERAASRNRGGLPEIHYHLAMVYHQLGRDGTARDQLQKALDSKRQFAKREAAEKLLAELSTK